jgi:REP element-mobilizing transposase RayT
MPPPAPLYLPENCRFIAPLTWGVSAFWRSPQASARWLDELTKALEPDGISVLGHRLSDPDVSQVSVSTVPTVAPEFIVQRVKGRLQYLVRATQPKPFHRNFAIRSYGHVTRSVVENYVATQLGHHRMADPRIQKRFERFQIEDPAVDLSLPQHTSHGIFWYNLHLVLVHRERWAEVRESVLQDVHDMIRKVARLKGYRLSRAGILADHIHLTLGCPFGISPVEVALSYLNNLAYVHGMKPVFQYGAYIGTFGEYDQRVVASDVTPSHGDKLRGDV